MLIEYFEENGAAVITRCYGTERRVSLPETIEGHAVRAVADHCFAAQPSFGLRSIPKEYALGENGDPEYAHISGQEAKPLLAQLPCISASRLLEAALGAQLTQIGDYAFYGCRELEKICFPAGLLRVGGGVFVAANHIQTLWFETPGDVLCPACMKEVLSEISYETEAVIADGGRVKVKLMFPEYYEDSVENTPARIIWVKYEGTGYKYRQCFVKGQIDFHQYDSLLYETSVQEVPLTLVRLCLTRLMYPEALEEEIREKYIACLREKSSTVHDYIETTQRMDLLRMLAQEGYFTQPLLEDFLQCANAHADAEAVGFLLDFRREHLMTEKRGKHKYEL